MVLSPAVTTVSSSSSVRSDVRVKKLYNGAMGISNKPFLKSYQDPGSSQFNQLASLVSQQVRPAPPGLVWVFLSPGSRLSVLQLKRIYSRNSVLAKAFRGSKVETFR